MPRAANVTTVPKADPNRIFLRSKLICTKMTPKITPIKPAMATRHAESNAGSKEAKNSIGMMLKKINRLCNDR